MRAPDPFGAWWAALEARHLESLTFAEVRRALQALSSLYVERRDRLARGRAFDGAGKRAAFALFYGPLHFLTVREVVRGLGASTPPPSRIVDLGCGTGAAGAAWALESAGRPSVSGVDASGWAIGEAAWSAELLGLAGRYRRGDLLDAPVGAPGEGVVAGYAVNELEREARDALLERLLAATAKGSRVLVIEPIARRGFSWWPAWSTAFLAVGGREDEWRFPIELPQRLRLLDRAAGLDHRVLTARSLWSG